jgi:hypothetical protein
MGTTNSAATTVTIPTTVEIDGWTYEVTAIASRAFYKNTTLTKITIPSTVKVINCGAFFGCTSLKTVSGAKSVEKIYKNAFRDCKQLKTLGGTSGRLTLPSVTFLGKRAFLNCTAATKLLISSQNLKTIAAGAFRNCASLTKVNISSTELAHIGAYAFYKDAKLTSIIFYTEELTTSNVGGKAFKGIHASAIFQIPSGKTSAYKTLFQTKGAGSTISVKAL